MTIRKLKKRLSPIDRTSIKHFKGWLRTYRTSNFKMVDKHFICFYKDKYKKALSLHTQNK